jgi:hypothetical protein
MSYEELPDPRPFGVRLALGPLPRWVAIVAGVAVALLAAAAAAAAWADPARLALWGTAAVAAALAAGHYVAAIRWSDKHHTWPRRHSRRRGSSSRSRSPTHL